MSLYIAINKRPSISICALKLSRRRSHKILPVGFFSTSFTASMTGNGDEITEKLIRRDREERKTQQSYL